MKKTTCILLCIWMVLSLTSCKNTAEETASFEAMDTVMSLKVYGGDGICGTLEARAHELDELLSSADTDSEIYRLNKNGTARLTGDALTLINRSLSLSAETDGSFDMTVYPAVCAWGFISGNYQIPDGKTLDALAQNIDYRQVSVNGDSVSLPENAAIDLGAVAKGYLADECADILGGSGASCAVLNLGGTILLYGAAFKVGVADPENPAGYFGYLSCGEGVVATSGGYERYFEQDGVRYIHILDPKTAKPVDNGTLSVTIFSDDGVLSDALSTALFVMGIDKATAYYQNHDGFDFILLTDDGKLYVTEEIYDRFSLADGCSYQLKKVKK